ncbi:MAG TPA: hypothetical protein VFP30_02785 [Candidatus Limnocylindria bacterium]|nr:hypothetical protein [Candidatus Limnocylindria bacterium]
MPSGRRRVGGSDVLLIERASALIEELGAELDMQLRTEGREGERLRLLRATTNRITRTANDAIHAYGRARRAIDAAIERDDANRADALAMRRRLQVARKQLLGTLAVASERYPASDDAAADPTVPDRAEDAT